MAGFHLAQGYGTFVTSLSLPAVTPHKTHADVLSSPRHEGITGIRPGFLSRPRERSLRTDDLQFSFNCFVGE